MLFVLIHLKRTFYYINNFDILINKLKYYYFYQYHYIINYHYKYLKYKKKYLQFKKHKKVQFGGVYNIDDEIIFVKNNKEKKGIIIQKINDKNNILYKIKTENDEEEYIYDKNIKYVKKNKIKLNKINKKKPLYENGDLIKFVDQVEYKYGIIIDRKYSNDKYIYITKENDKIHNIDERNIIRKVNQLEFDNFKNKIIFKDTNIDGTVNDKHLIKYTNCINDNYQETYIESKFDKMNSVINVNECSIILTFSMLNDNEEIELFEGKFFMDIQKKNKLLKCINYPLLTQELKIMKYIKKNSYENKIFNITNQHLITIYEEQIFTKNSFDYLLNMFKMQMNNDEKYLLEKYQNNYDISNFDSNFNGIIEPFNQHSLIDNTDVILNKNVEKNVFNILYSIYLLHTQFDIMHHNCYLNNFYIEKDENKTQEYLINNNYYKMDTDYLIKLGDFDLSTKIKKYTQTDEIINNELKRKQMLCYNEGKCNLYNQKDIFIIISSLLTFVYDNKTQKINEDLYKIILVITNYHYGLISFMIKNNNKLNENVFTSFCNFDNEILIKTGDLQFKEHECANTVFEDLEITNIMNRYIEKYDDILNLYI